jgi:hypothetical protein
MKIETTSEGVVIGRLDWWKRFFYFLLY